MYMYMYMYAFSISQQATQQYMYKHATHSSSFFVRLQENTRGKGPKKTAHSTL